MTYNERFNKSIFTYTKPEFREDWERLMLAERRDWNHIYRDFKGTLSKYIGNVRLLAYSNNASALTELANLEEVFQWDEKFLADWVIQVDEFTHTVEYDSYEEMNEALLGHSCPEDDAGEIWETHCGANTCYWSYANNPEIIIDNLRMKK
jgi:hypothetical protein